VGSANAGGESPTEELSTQPIDAIVARGKKRQLRVEKNGWWWQTPQRWMIDVYEGFAPICAYCAKVRSVSGPSGWYVHSHLDSQ